MTLLGIDTSTPAASAAVLRDDGEAFEVLPPPERLQRPPAHAAELMPAVAEAMERAGVDWSDLDAIAVGVGPGTFTGLRIGIATARALATAAGLPLRRVSSLAALGRGDRQPGPAAADRRPPGRGVRGAVRGRAGVLAAARHAGPEELIEQLGNAAVTPLAAGDGSLRFRGMLEAAGIPVEPDRLPGPRGERPPRLPPG